jgi:hypothetical protein
MSTEAIQTTPLANHSKSEESTTAQPPAPIKKKRASAPLPVKIQKRIDSLNAKVEKLTKENKVLKEERKKVKSASTRIHRIPKAE